MLDAIHNEYIGIMIICSFFGDGTSKPMDILKLENSRFFDEECLAKHMIGLSEENLSNKLFEEISYYEPFYFKGPNITVSKKNILR